MSHIPQRKEKDCLNCGTVVQGRYCHECGQENVVPKETFWHMVTHFFNDITHFDGSFFITAKDLLFKPGFLSKEYMAGRRVKYLHPVRMYVFTSAIFFLLFFSFFSTSNIIKVDKEDFISGKERLSTIARLEKRYKNDSSKVDFLQQLQVLKDTITPLGINEFALLSDDFAILDLSGSARKYKSIEEYDSVQMNLSKNKRDGWFKRRLVTKEINLNTKYGKKPTEAINKLGNEFLHKLPYLLFVSLPLFALILRLLYIRRKQFYFADHGIFTIHLYVFNFILLLLVFAFDKVQKLTGYDIFRFLIVGLFFLLAIYLYKALRYFYGQGRTKTIIKFLIIFFASFIMMVVLLAFFLFFTAFTL